MQEVFDVASASPDPVFNGLRYVGISIAMAVGVVVPLLGLAKYYKGSKSDMAKSEAESRLYENLKEQLERHSKALETLDQEKKEWLEKSLRLEHEVEKLSDFKDRYLELKGVLHEKEQLLEVRNGEISVLNSALREMSDRIHALELRIVTEDKDCASCSNRKATTINIVSGSDD